MSILEKVKKQMEKQANVMEGRTKGDTCPWTSLDGIIKDFTILKDKNTDSEYSAFIVEGNDEEFFFGGSVVTDKLKRICDMLTDEELAELKKEGLPVMFVGKKSKNKNSKIVLCIETNEKYLSITEAQRKTNIKHIRDVCIGKRKSAGKLHWKFIEEE